MKLIFPLLRALAITLASELAVSLVFIRSHVARTRELLVTVTLMNLITNPALNLALILVTTYARATYYPTLVAGEAIVFSAEALILHLTLRLSGSRAALVSLILNLSSFLIGTILTPILS